MRGHVARSGTRLLLCSSLRGFQARVRSVERHVATSATPHVHIDHAGTRYLFGGNQALPPLVEVPIRVGHTGLKNIVKPPDCEWVIDFWAGSCSS